MERMIIPQQIEQVTQRRLSPYKLKELRRCGRVSDR